LSASEIEVLLKKGDVPRSQETVETHTISAVRMLKHIRKGYQKELSQTDALLRSLEGLNMRLAKNNEGHSDEDIGSAYCLLESVEASLSRKQVAVKRIVTSDRISRAKDMLSKAQGMEGAEREMQTSRACAMIVSIRNRLGSWRDKQVAGIVRYNLQRESALRMHRDQWLFGQLVRFAESTNEVHGFWQTDGAKRDVLSSVAAMIKEKRSAEEILAYMKSKHTLFRAESRKRENAEMHVALCEVGVQPTVGTGIDYMIGHYAWLYRFIRSGAIERAKDKIWYLQMFVDANKPDFILRELQKDPDPYLKPALAAMRTGVEAFKAGDLDSAKGHFAASRDLIKPFAYPGVV
jgi:hypothetical protein